MEMIMP
jgi:hypothetical protein